MIKTLLFIVLFLFINNCMNKKYNTVYDVYHKVHNDTSKTKEDVLIYIGKLYIDGHSVLYKTINTSSDKNQQLYYIVRQINTNKCFKMDFPLKPNISKNRVVSKRHAIKCIYLADKDFLVWLKIYLSHKGLSLKKQRGS